MSKESELKKVLDRCYQEIKDAKKDGDLDRETAYRNREYGIRMACNALGVEIPLD